MVFSFPQGALGPSFGSRTELDAHHERIDVKTLAHLFSRVKCGRGKREERMI